MTDLDTKLSLRRGSLGRESVILTLGSGAAMVAGLAVLGLLVKSLATAEVGMLILVSTYPLLIHQFFSLQSWQGYSRHALALLDDGQNSEFRALTKSFFLLDAACAVLAAAAGVLLTILAIPTFDWPEAWRWYLGLFSLTLLVNFSSFSFAVFRSFKAYRVQTLCTLLLPLAQLLAASVFAYQNRPINDYLTAWLVLILVSNLCILAAAVLVLRFHGMSGWLRSAERAPRGALTFTAWVNAATSLDCVVKQGDVLLVSALVSVETVPVYRLIKQAGALLYRFADAVAQAIYPRLVSLVVADRQRQALSLFRRSALWSAGFAMLGTLVLATTSFHWLPLLFTVEFTQAASVLTAYLLIVAVAVAFTSLHQLVYALGYVKLPVLFTFAAVSLFLLVTIGLAPDLGLWAFVAGFSTYHFVAISAKLALLGRHYLNLPQHAAAH